MITQAGPRSKVDYLMELIVFFRLYTMFSVARAILNQKEKSLRSVDTNLSTLVVKIDIKSIVAPHFPILVACLRMLNLAKTDRSKTTLLIVDDSQYKLAFCSMSCDKI